jgi:hypothetical protein
MSPWEIVIPIIWACGLLGAGFVISLWSERKYCPEYFFPSAGILGLIVFALGLSGVLYKSVFIVITIILAAFFIWMIFRTYHELIRYVKTKPFYLLIVIVPLLWYILAALSYPVSADALYFHLGLPKIYAAVGKVFYIPANLFSASPRTSEMITTAFYALRLERGAQVFIVLVAAILVFSIWKRARELGGSGTIAILILFTIPIFTGQVTGSKNDYLLWGLSFFACLKLLQYDQDQKMLYLLLAGIGAGMTAGTKAIGLALFAPLALLTIYNVALGKYRASHLVYFTLLFLLFASPWYTYSWIVAGNPVYPFFDNIFHSPYSSTLFNSFNKELAIKAIDRNLLSLVISPFRIIFDPEAFDGRLGYGILLFPALLIITKRVPQAIKMALGLSVIFYLIWFLGFPFARFILPVAPLLAIAGSYFISSALKRGKALKYSAMISLGIGVILPLPSVIRDTLPRVASVVKATPKYEFLESYQTLDPYQPQSGKTIEGLSYIKCWEYINNHTPSDSRIGIMASFWTRADGYYLDRDFTYLNPSEQNLYDFTAVQNSDDVRTALTKLGISYIVLDSVVLEQFSDKSAWTNIYGFWQFASGINALRQSCERLSELVYADNRYRVYRVN